MPGRMAEMPLKLLILVSFLLLHPGFLRAEVADYGFTGFFRTFTPITGGAPVFDGATDETVSAALPIGFTFSYNGQDFTELYVSSNGFIKLGGVAPPATAHGDIFSASGPGSENIIAPMGFDLVGRPNRPAGSVRIETAGSVGNRSCTIQWLAWQFKGLGADIDVSFQAILYEANRAIEFCYTSENVSLASAAEVSVGLKGSTPADFHLRTTNSNWAATSKAAANTDTCTFSASVNPLNNQVLRFTRPIAAIIAIGNVTLPEGSTGETTSFNLQVLVSPAPAADVTIDYTLDFATADHGDVTTPDTGTFLFDGDGVTTSRFLAIDVRADKVGEIDEKLSVVLSNPSLGEFLDNTGAITIQDDDFNCGVTQTFGTASGTTPPAGWSVVNHNAPSGAWEFQMPVTYDMPPATTRQFGAPIALPFAYIDSDVGPVGEHLLIADLVSPSFDCSSSPLVRLRFDHMFRTLKGDVRGAVEVSVDGGNQWSTITVYSQDSDGVIDGLAEAVDLDLSAIAGGQADVRIRWSYLAEFDYYWIVDNVRLCRAGLPETYTTLRVGDAIVAESSLETNVLDFEMTTAAPLEGDVQLEWRAVDGTALLNEDFDGSAQGTLSLLKGETLGHIRFDVPPDMSFEPDESMSLMITIVSGPALSPDSVGLGTILNDDTPIIPALGGNNTQRDWQLMDAANGNADVIFPYADPSDFYNGGDFIGLDVSNLVCWNGRTEKLDTVNFDSHTITPGPAITGGFFGTDPIDFSWNPVDNKLYGLFLDFGGFTSMVIGTVNPSTGAFAFKQIYEAANTAGGIGTWSAIAHDSNGTLYAMGWDDKDGKNISLYRPNLSLINTATLVGSSGIDNGAAFFFADFDARSGILFAAVPDDSGLVDETNLFRVDVADGSMELVGTSPGFVRTWAVATQVATTTEGWMLTE